ncbi:Alpha/Beta hydrolase protein [Thelephora terrestris]|uniref:Alpha/Beta hydrolase protein n=1 Tax=Thelephora terrestris TaxID=56493 RepID=A0A9P6H770_9AGAM|nr:Alpha/Beta hydrolase protein [Thelephora terrestris]
MTIYALKLLRLVFNITAMIAYIPRWFVSGMRILLYEDRKGNWTLGRHMCGQVMRYSGIRQKKVLCFFFRSDLISSRTLESVSNHLILNNRLALPNSTVPDHTAVQGPAGVWIPAVPEGMIIGEISALARDRNITSISIPGYWIHKDNKLGFESPPSPGEKVLYHLHGGAYIIGSAHPDGILGRVSKELLKYSSSPSFRRTFGVEYRLSKWGEPGKRSEFPFPTALIDALAGYLYLIKLGFSEEDIIIAGDSAGGNLALALTRYLLLKKGKERRLPKVPAALVLLSPYTDASSQFVDNPGPQSSLTINAERDWLEPIHEGVRRLDALAFLGGRPEDVELAYRNPYVSAASPILLGLTPDSPTRTIYFKGFPRTFIDNGSFDVLYDQVLLLANAMVEDLGEDMVVYNEVAGAPHDYLFLPWCDPDGPNTAKKILEWLWL